MKFSDLGGSSGGRRSPMAGRSPMAQAAGGQPFDVAAAIGGPRGLAETVLPSVLFVAVYSLTENLRTSLISALAIAVLAAVVRLAQRQSLTQALSGVVSVGFCAFVAARTGQAQDFFLPGLLINVVYGTVWAVSTLQLPAFRIRSVRFPGGPFPILGLMIGPITGEGLAWRRNPARMRAYRQVTWFWVALFAIRLVVQVPLYLTEQVGLLGTARVAMGLPLFALTLWCTYLVLRRVPPAVPDAAPAANSTDATSTDATSTGTATAVEPTKPPDSRRDQA